MGLSLRGGKPALSLFFVQDWRNHRVVFLTDGLCQSRNSPAPLSRCEGQFLLEQVNFICDFCGLSFQAVDRQF
jgi:hypothetical protein